MKSHTGRNSIVYQPPDTNRVKNIIAVASGKGGVGKSTVTANLALALLENGNQVGVLDADIYGPSQGKMLGVSEGTRPKVIKVDGLPYYSPVQAYKLQVMSMAFLTDERTPMIWRGPMASGALQQMLLQTWWDGLDVLLVDMPPGTGDIQLTLSQKVSLTGSVVVTTPQDIALLDARRAVEMFAKVKVPTLGVVENMAWHTCHQCGHKEAIFGEGGGETLARDYDTCFLGAVPLAISIREKTDAGKPLTFSEPKGEYAKAYQLIATKLMEQVNDISTSPPTIHIDH